jgi:hypothetical protein
MPKWLTTGITHILPKSEDAKEPKNYLPVSCFSATYKTLTGIIVERI